MIEYRVGIVKTRLDECNGDRSGHVLGKDRADVFKGIIIIIIILV